MIELHKLRSRLCSQDSIEFIEFRIMNIWDSFAQLIDLNDWFEIPRVVFDFIWYDSDQNCNRVWWDQIWFRICLLLLLKSLNFLSLTPICNIRSVMDRDGRGGRATWVGIIVSDRREDDAAWGERERLIGVAPDDYKYYSDKYIFGISVFALFSVINHL